MDGVNQAVLEASGTIDTVLNIIQQYGWLSYCLLLAYCALKSGALPLFAGYAAQSGALDVGLVLATAFAGGYLGDEARFFFMRRYGAAALASRPRIAGALQRGRALLERYGTAYIFLYRYPKGLRTIGAPPFGLTSITWPRFTSLNAASAALWAAILVGSGYIFGETIEYAVKENWGLFSVALLAMVLLFFALAWRRVEPKLQTAS